MGAEKITNLTRRASITAPFERADTLFARARGLMFRQKPLAILFSFETFERHSIHSFFVPFEFDAVYLNEYMKVVDLYSRVKPFVPLLTPARSAFYLLELPPGDAARLKLQIGDEVKIGK
ncbi:MAG: DUF192 domain-containing protein [Candidatus Micrarchaeota archaeon]|nr:DUF192 domain-containing protein [Candidatus Micrarchaeota archaeon]